MKAPFFENVIPNSAIKTYLTTKKISLKELKIYFEKCQAKNFVQMEQIHEDKIAMLSEKNSESKILMGCDALVTTKRKQVLMVRTADCLPILVFHPLPVIAVIHAGRKGTRQEIARKTISKIQKDYKIKDGFSFFFGPAICFKCYEVDKKKAEHFNLVEENINQIKSGLKDSQFIRYSSLLCTSCHNDQFYSYRADHKTEHRNYSAIMLS